jgi:histidyl-tRNA synthetase
MPPSLRAPRGTRDLLPDERVAFTRLERIGRDLAARYGYRDMETPLFEQAAVFERGIGAVTDVVEKELFRVLPSRGEEREAWALRPEATAGICRAYVEHGMQTWPQPVRLSLAGPMFRYDRPQAGRFRQFWQWDVEAIGDAGPAIDAELVELGARFYRDAGLSDVEILLNSIGDAACRPAYLATLVAHYRGAEARLPELERRRLETNPLRLLDSKDPAMADVNAAAPRITDHLCAACAAHFAAVRAHLDAMGVTYRLEPGLVRGLDYYTRTAFEFYRHGAEGQQQALGGGGRYDGLIELLGGKPTAGIGFALGLDRVVLALAATSGSAPTEAVPVAVVVGADPGDTLDRLRIATDLRGAGLPVRADLAVRKLGRQLEAAVREGAQFAVILGDELASGEVQLRDLDGGSQKTVALADLPALLRRKVRASETQ